VTEFIAYAKAHPGKVTLVSPGTGSAPHLAGELFRQMAKIDLAHVPYRGAAPALNDLIPGRVDYYFGSGALLENMRSGQIRGLGVTGLKRRSGGAGTAHDRRGRGATRSFDGRACSFRPRRRLKSSGK
jgi:tripartite-type tricarboxylate transporter receptor subunit TctC